MAIRPTVPHQRPIVDSRVAEDCVRPASVPRVQGRDRREATTI
jgi:hypothetical protein